MGEREEDAGDSPSKSQEWDNLDALADANRPRPGYLDLIAWQRGMALMTAVYRETASWPGKEQYGLISQIQRAAVAIPSNLAEGHGRSGPREFAHHTSIAYGSLCEVETHIYAAAAVGYAKPEAAKHLLTLANDVRRFTLGLLRSLNERAKRRPGANP